MNLTPEALIADLSNHRELRVKYVERDDAGQIQAVALFDCTAERPEPLLSFDEVTERLENGQWAVMTADAQTEFDRELGHVRSEEDIVEKRRARWTARKEVNWKMIESTHRLGIQAFDPECRRESLRAAIAASGAKCKLKWAEQVLFRFWKSGNNQMAVGPQNFRAGAKPRLLSAQSDSDGQARRRVGANTKVDIAYPSGVRSDRGGNHLPPMVLNIMMQQTDQWLDDHNNQHVIKVSLKRYGGLPWERIKKSVNNRLQGLEQFRHIAVTRRQLQYLCGKKVDIARIFKKCRGSRAFNLKHRPLNGDYRSVANYFGQRFEVDTFIADIHLVDDTTGVPIGRPRVYLVVDVFSGLVVGVYVTIKETDYAHVARALHAAFSNMADYAALFGLKIDKAACPGGGMPEEIVGDNKELVAKAAKYLPEVVDVGVARPYRGDDKGTVEITSSLLQSGHIMLYNEGCTEGPKGRGEDDPAKRATVRMSTFVCELLRHVITVHNHRVFPKDRPLPEAFLRAKLSPTPFNVATWSIRAHGQVLRKYEARTMMPRLLPPAEATITRRGLEVGGLVFELPPGSDHVRAASSLTNLEKMRVHYDPLSTNQVYIVPKDLAAEPVACKLADHSREFRDRHWEEKRIRDEYVESIRRLGQHEKEQRESAAAEAQRAALIEDSNRLKGIYGTMRMRNAVKEQIDEDAIKSAQLASDDQRHDAWMHGGLRVPADNGTSDAPPPQENPKTPVPETTAPAISTAEPTKADFLKT